MSVRSRWWGIAVLAVAGLVALRVLAPIRQDLEKPSAAMASESARSSSTDRLAPNDSAATRSAGKVIESDWDELLAWLESDPRPGESEIRARLLALRGKWAEMDPILVAETIARLLASNRDATTGMKFRVGLHGFLDAWPSLRVFLLDALVIADAETAAGVARAILDTTKSPDEYAVALRSLTRFDGIHAADGELMQRFSHALNQPDWQTSSGFAESLDLARSIASAPAAAELLRWNGNPTLKSMALHEFAADHPAAMLAALETTTTVDPSTRANLMARLDPAEPDQFAALDAYLLDPHRTPDETSTFLKSFPLRSATTGNRLYSPSPAPYEMGRIAAGDRAALQLVDQWLAEPSLGASRPALLALRTRLATWVDQTK